MLPDRTAWLSVTCIDPEALIAPPIPFPVGVPGFELPLARLLDSVVL